MPTRDTPWPHGTPCWADCSVDDLDGARRFYGHLFGWDVENGPAEHGGYVTALKHGRAVAGLAPRRGDAAPAWVVYLATDDVDDTCRRVVDAGGSVRLEPADMGDLGRTAICADTSGAVFGLWQAGHHSGYQLVHDSGSVTWNDLVTSDLAAATTFYGSVFGYSFTELDGAYVTFALRGDDTPVGGMHLAGELVDGDVGGWLTHFAVADRESTIALVEMEEDAGVLNTFSLPFGESATVRGPEGEVFMVIELHEGVQLPRR